MTCKIPKSKVFTELITSINTFKIFGFPPNFTTIFVVKLIMVIDLFLTSKSSLSFGSTVVGDIVYSDPAHIYVRLENKITLKIPKEDIKDINEIKKVPRSLEE